MSEKPVADLAELTLETCRTLVNQDFTRPNEAGDDVVLRLVSAEFQGTNAEIRGTGDRPFSLLFEGPVEMQLTQGMHDLNHPKHPFVGIFLVPMGDNGEGPQYEAIFS